MNEFAASLSTAATSAAACSMPGGLEDGIVGGVADDHVVRLAGHTLRVGLDDDEVALRRVHIVGDGAPDAAPPADDDVTALGGDRLFHATSPEQLVEAAFDDSSTMAARRTALPPPPRG